MNTIWREAAAAVCLPRPRMTVSEWADANREIPQGTSPWPGHWRTERTPYLKTIMDALVDPAIETIVVMVASMLGKSECCLNILGYFVDQDPAPILVVHPTIEAMEAFSKERIDPMFRATAALRERSRDLYMGTPLATGALKTLRTNIVGQGLRLNAQVDAASLGLTQDEADAWEANVEREFGLWADTQACDAARTNTFGQLQALALLSSMMSGDCFVLLPILPRPGSIYDLRVQLLEGDRVCDPSTGNLQQLQNLYAGVELGELGEPVAYWVAIPYSWIEKEPPARFIKISSRPLPVPIQIGAFLKATVVA